jgi:hypothetical protein
MSLPFSVLRSAVMKLRGASSGTSPAGGISATEIRTRFVVTRLLIPSYFYGTAVGGHGIFFFDPSCSPAIEEVGHAVREPQASAGSGRRDARLVASDERCAHRAGRPRRASWNAAGLY